MRLLLDEMWSAEVAAALRERGHDVQAVTERADLRGQEDEFIFMTAQMEGRAVVTENVGDFRQLAYTFLSRGERHCGLILTTNRRYPRHDSRTLGTLVLALHGLLELDVSIESSEYWLA